MANYTLHTTRFFDGHRFYDDALLTIKSGLIAAVRDAIPVNVANADYEVEGLLVPGFVDLQVNGGGGVLLNNTPTVQGIETMIQAHAQFGTTTMLPTLITDDIEVMKKAADAIADTISKNVLGIAGIHFEGPHLSVAKKGAHSEGFIRPISSQEWQILSRTDLGQIVVTLAPETVPTSDIQKMVSLGIKVCLGHTNADFETAQKAINAGADGFTHLFNAMSPIEGRAPGVVGCALLNDSASCGLIVDGHHVDYASCKIAIKTKPKGSVFLVTDAMPPVGTEQTSFSFFDRTVNLDSGKLTSTTGELAGSVLDMATAVKNTHQKVGLSLDESLCMASFYPADYINQLDNIGHLSIGTQADMVLLSDELLVQATWIKGIEVFKRTPR